MSIKHSEQDHFSLTVRIPADLYSKARAIAFTRYERVETLVPKLLQEYINRCKELDGEA